MIEIGQYNTLEILRDTEVGLFLGDEEDNDILLPNKYVPKHFEIGDTLTVFVYLDHEERPVSTTLKPYVMADDFAFLEVNYINEFGAFLNWGLEKDLFVPFKEQAVKMVVGKRYFVFCFIDEITNRLVASSKTNQFLSNKDINLKVNEEVELIIGNRSDLGYNVVVNNYHSGLIFFSTLLDDNLRPGDKMMGFVRTIRPDNKLDIVLERWGAESIEPNADKVLERLREERGFLNLHDKSSPEEIKHELGMSKKVFKKAIGSLYKEKIIRIDSDGIHLI